MQMLACIPELRAHARNVAQILTKQLSLDMSSENGVLYQADQQMKLHS